MKKPALMAVLAAWALSLACLSPGEAAAQCDYDCMVLTNHWHFNWLSNNDSSVTLGMSCNSEGRGCRPVLCDDFTGYVRDYAWQQPLYDRPVLTEDTSICAFDGNDAISVLDAGLMRRCKVTATQSIYMFGISTGGYTLGVYLGRGDDDLYSGSSDADMFVCGYDGDDTIVTDGGHQYILAQYGNDGVSGGADDDNIRGGGNKDILYHVAGSGPAGTDKVRADSGTDCVGITAPLAADSSCGVDTDYYMDLGGLRPASCEHETSDCYSIWF
jgi:hypothetical protein